MGTLCNAINGSNIDMNNPYIFSFLHYILVYEVHDSELCHDHVLPHLMFTPHLSYTLTET